MKLVGLRLPDKSGYSIEAGLLTSQSDIIPINFVIDTGCTITTLKYYDFVKTGINFNTLEQVDNKTLTANGEISVKRIGPIGITFELGDFLIYERLKEIHVKSPNINNGYDEVSVLGLDFLEI